MKKLFTIFVFLLLSACVQYIPWESNLDVSNEFSDPNNLRVAVLPARAVDNKHKKVESSLTSKFTTGLKEIGFKVKSEIFVSDYLYENGIDPTKQISISTMAKIQEDLKVDAIVVSKITYRLIAARSNSRGSSSKKSPSSVNVNITETDDLISSIGNSNETKYETTEKSSFSSSASGEKYRAESETLTIIDAISKEVLLEVFITPSKGYERDPSMSNKILKDIKEHFNPPARNRY